MKIILKIIFGDKLVFYLPTWKWAGLNLVQQPATKRPRGRFGFPFPPFRHPSIYTVSGFYKFLSTKLVVKTGVKYKTRV